MNLAKNLKDFYNTNPKLKSLKIETTDVFSESEKYTGYFDGSSAWKSG
jgi:hypothetical protein